MKKTGIIATLGPSSRDRRTIVKMIKAGMTAARFNLSHGSPQKHMSQIRILREASRACGRKTEIILDFKGNRIRIGELKKPVKIRKGEKLFLFRPGNARPKGKAVPFDYGGRMEVIRKGTPLYIDDGNICLEAVRAETDCIETRVASGNEIKSRKGVNIPGANLDFPPISPEDIADIRILSGTGADWAAHSFVRSAEELSEMRKVLDEHGMRSVRIIAKLEAKEAMERMDEIINRADAVMVARGDMGISFPVWEVPFLQKVIIRKCNSAGKPVITATQMLESMTEHYRPTRAEVSDVANAILDGTDYVMLSAETAAGKYPVESVAMMKKIAEYAKKHERTKSEK